MGATTARRDKSAFGAAHRRRLARMDTAKAVKATVHQLARLIYAMLTRGEDYVARDIAAWEAERRERMIVNLQCQAKRFDLALVSADAASIQKRSLTKVVPREGTVGRDSGGGPAGIVIRSARFVQRAEWRSRWNGGRDRAMDGRIGHGSPTGLVGEQAFGDVVSVSRIRPMLVDRSALSGIASHCSGHPLRTRFVLADGVGTVRTLALSRAAVPFRVQWNVLPRLCWRAPVSISRGWAADPGVSLGNPRSGRPFSRLQPG